MDHLHFLCATICLLTMFKSSLTIHTLSPDQTLGDQEVLTSPNQEFELGFFSPGKSTSKFLGMWYKATPDVVVWVANRNDPITNPPGVLTLSQNGTLLISSTNQSSKSWSLNPSRPVSSTPALQLLDSGNLVLVDNSSNIWQSFDYPTDTRLPGMKMVDDPDTFLTSWKSADDPSVGEYSFRIENNGLSQTVVKKGNETTFRGIFWNGYFPGYPIAPGQAWNNEVETKEGRLVALFNIFNGSSITRLTMNYTGMLQRYMMNENRDGWSGMVESPRFSCEKYGFCGNNSICLINRTPECECLRGFRPKSEREWGVFEWEGGCYRSLPSDCQTEDGFLRMEGVKFPDSLDFRLNTSMNIHECRDECLKNCSCTAYADPLSNSNSSCLMWFGDLVDVKELTNGDGRARPSVYIRVPASELERVTDGKVKKKGSTKMKLISAVAASGVGLLILGLLFGGVLLRMRRKRQAYTTETTAYTPTREELELPLFDLATIAAATNDFARENLIGEGGFGPVYKGNLSRERVVAVKRMSATSGQGPEEFKNEVNLIAKLQHRNLVKILGCCTEGQEKMLIYEYMHNKSLDYFIFDEKRKAELSWPKRFNIIMGIARGLLYLHHDSRLKIIHRDLKTSNILLDENLNSKISDFGLARMFEGDETIERTKRVAGTYGYMAPEYAFNGKFSIKSDVFSLGVVILEIVSGKKNRGFEHSSMYQNLLEQAWLYCMEDRELELMDGCYNYTYKESQVKRCIRVGLLCVQNSADDRPMMSSVLVMLSSDDTVLPQPKKPGFFLHNSERFSHDHLGGDKSSSTSNAMSMTDIEAR